MKKLLLSAIFLLGAGMAQAQLKVNAFGNVAIADNPSSINKLRIHSDEYDGIYVSTTPGEYSSGTGVAVYGNPNTDPSCIYGIKAGVQGATILNASIFGRVYQKGAAILGSTQDYSFSLTQPYAGYFYGNVQTQGNMTSSGGFSGTFLTPTPSSANEKLNLSSYSQKPQSTVSDLLYGFRAIPYYQDQTRLITARQLRNDNGDSAVVVTEKELPLSYMERQVLTKRHFSLSADQLEEVFPDLVYENEDGTKSINYVEMVPILVQAINELSAKVTALEGNNGAARKVATNVDGIGEGVQVLSLGQNRPNPFGTTTEIEVMVPENVQSAFVYVYDLQGKEVQQVDITGRGKQTVQLNAAELADGMYLYSLIADGQVVETRRMIIRK